MGKGKKEEGENGGRGKRRKGKRRKGNGRFYNLERRGKGEKMKGAWFDR